MFKQKTKKIRLLPKIFLSLGVFFLWDFLFVGNVSAEIIFEDNFDNIPDWHQATKKEGCSDSSCKDTVPGEWDFYNNDELWHPSEYPDKHATSNIDSQNFRGTSGKAFTEYNESHDGSSGDGWGNDGILAKDLGQDYDEIWVQMYIKFQPGFQWRTDPGSSIKLFRAYHWDREGSTFAFFSSGNNAPLYQFYPGRNTYHDTKQEHGFRCKPQETNYYCEENYYTNIGFVNEPTFTEFIGDGNWHKYTWHLKVNSAPNVSDGLTEFWIDDTLQFSKYNMKFTTDTYTGSYGWNVIAIGGNCNNIWTDVSNKAEQWYAIDDVVISTEQIPDDYIIGRNTIRADVDQSGSINSIDAMLTLRNSLGLDMSQTNWFFSATTGDVNCDGTTNSTDAMLILRYSLGLDMSGTNWCEN